MNQHTPISTDLRVQMLGLAIGAVASLVLGTLFLLTIGERPSLLFEALGQVCGTGFGLGYTLYYATPLMLAGLSVALCLRAGLFNIGAEGQLYWGAIGIVVFAVRFPNLSPWLAIPGGCLSAAVFGAVWGGIAGVIKAKRGGHEVLTTILLNFIGISIVNYLILYPLHPPGEQNVETFVVSPAYHLPSLDDLLAPLGIGVFHSTPVNLTLLGAMALAFLVHGFLQYTATGFSMRVVGENPVAARFAGISVSRQTILAFLLGGALSGLVGVNEVMGHQGRVVEGFSPGYGFSAIAVAMVAKGHPIAVIPTAFLFGALHNGARELEFLSDRVAKELAMVLQAVLIAGVASPFFVKWVSGRWGRRPRTPKAATPVSRPTELLA